MLFVVDPHAEVRGETGKGILRATMTAAAKKRIVDLVEHGIGMDYSGHLGRSLQRAAAKQAADEAKYLKSLSGSHSRSRSLSRSRSRSLSRSRSPSQSLSRPIRRRRRIVETVTTHRVLTVYRRRPRSRSHSHSRRR